MRTLTTILLLFTIISCKKTNTTYPDIKIAGAMKNVMWKGELDAVINLDTIENKKGLYGLGPLSYLKGEILINDGTVYQSIVTSDSTMSVIKDKTATAPFFVYGYVNQWTAFSLPSHIKTIKDLEKHIDQKTKTMKRPFVFKLKGNIDNAQIHIQNLPSGTKVTSPQEAHQGQVNYQLENQSVEIIGFFSTEHKGIFTHHDSNMHLHLITQDEKKMGHLDRAVFNDLTLYLPME